MSEHEKSRRAVHPVTMSLVTIILFLSARIKQENKKKRLTFSQSMERTWARLNLHLTTVIRRQRSLLPFSFSQEYIQC
jgi:hypothetical protein